MTKNIESPPSIFQDICTRRVETILLPISGHNFERMALDTALYISQKHNAKIDIVHIGEHPGPIINSYIDKLTTHNIKHELVIKPIQDVADGIINCWNEKHHDVIILAGRRKPSLFARLTIKGIANKIVPKVQAEVLQIFPPSLEKNAERVRNVSILLPYSKRDPSLLRWGTLVATVQKGATLCVYHISDVAKYTPITEDISEKTIKEEKKIFYDYIKKYSESLKTQISPKFIIGKNVISALEYVFGKEEPDILIIGHTEYNKRWYPFYYPLSSRIRDKLLNPGIAIHYNRKNDQ